MKRLLAIILVIKNDIIFLYHTLFDLNTTTRIRLAIIGIIVYVFSPIDIIGDTFPILGQIDDIAVILFVTSWIKSQTNKPSPSHTSSSHKKRIIRPLTSVK